MPGDQATCWELTPAATWQYFGTLNGRSGGRDINETRESSLFQHGANLCVIVHVMSCWYVILWANDSVNKWLISGPNSSTLLCILHLHHQPDNIGTAVTIPPLSQEEERGAGAGAECDASAALLPASAHLGDALD